jgi:hypothetical protein
MATFSPPRVARPASVSTFHALAPPSFSRWLSIARRPIRRPSERTNSPCATSSLSLTSPSTAT